MHLVPVRQKMALVVYDCFVRMEPVRLELPLAGGDVIVAVKHCGAAFVQCLHHLTGW